MTIYQTETDTEPKPTPAPEPTYVLRYDKDNHTYPTLDVCSNCAIDYFLSDNYKDIEFKNKEEVEQFQREVNVNVCCFQPYNVCMNLWFNCCQPFEQACGTMWCVVLEIPYCFLIATPWFCCNYNRVRKSVIALNDVYDVSSCGTL